MDAVIRAGAAAGTAAIDRRRRVIAIVGGSSGNLVEWYDFYVYPFLALYFAPSFFPSGDRTAQLLAAAGIFAAGFVMRPIGGWLFGRIADRRGRRVSMMISVLMMCGGSLMVAVLPTYASIGTMAPLLLLVARLVQGLSVGGEYGTSATYMSEVAIGGQRGFYGSFWYVTIIAGQLLAVLVLVVLQATLNNDQLHAWGWRIPFLIGAVGAAVALFLRRSLTETATAEARGRTEAGSVRALFRRHPRAIAIVIGLTAGGSPMFYTFTTYMQKYLVNTTGMDGRIASSVMTLVLVVYMLMQPVFGTLADRIGNRTSLIAFGVFGVLGTRPLLMAIGAVPSAVMAFVLIMAALAIVSLYSSISGLAKADLFPTEVRALGVGLSFSIGNLVFGGTTEYVAFWFKSVGSEGLFAWYITALCAVALAAAVWMPNTRKHGYLDGTGQVETRG